MKRLRVCFVTSQYDSVKSGPGTFARYMASALRDDTDIDFYILTQDASHPVPGVEAVKQPALVSRLPVGPLDLCRRFGARIGEFERLDRVDIVHFNTVAEACGTHAAVPVIGNANDYLRATSNARSFKSYVDEFGNGALRKWASERLWRRLERETLKRVDSVVVNSDFLGDALRNEYCLPDLQTVTIPKGVDIDLFTPKAPGTSSPGPVILFVGAPWIRKGLEDLVRAAALLKPRFPRARYLVAGAPQAGEERIVLGLVESLGLRDRFEFRGRVPRAGMPELYREADVLAVPSRYEAFGVTYLEAMASGVPVVASEVGGIPEIVSHGRNGFLVPCGKAAVLSEAVGRLLADEALRMRFAEAGRSTATAFATRTMVSRFRHLYLSIGRSAGLRSSHAH